MLQRNTIAIRWQCLLLCACVILTFSACKEQTTIEPTEPVAFTVTPTEVPVAEMFEFSYSPDIQVSYSKVVFSGEGAQIQITGIDLTEEEKRYLTDQLSLYKNSIVKNVLKSDFYSYYTVDLNEHISLMIDADSENYSRDVSYMFVNVQHDGSVRQYGTYVDASLISFLEEKVN